MSFTGKVAIVTGAGQGIGYEICFRLAEAGANVILNDVDAGMAARASSSISSKTNGTCIGIGGDASNLNCINHMVNTAVEKFGRLDIAIANAGITLFGNFFTYQPEALYKVMQVNTGGTFFLAQVAANQMKTQANGGSLLFIHRLPDTRRIKTLQLMA